MPSKSTNIAEREIKRYRDRLGRTIGLYLALFAWKAGLDGVVLTREDLQGFFGISNTGSQRIEQIVSTTTPWFEYHKPYYREGSGTYLHYLFLSKSSLEPYLPSGPSLAPSKMPKRSVVQKVLAGLDQNAPKLKLLSSLVEEIPKQSDIIKDLALFTAGMKTPKLKSVP